MQIPKSGLGIMCPIA